MKTISKGAAITMATAMLALTTSAAIAQDARPGDDPTRVVTADRAQKGPEVKGIITARRGDKMQVTADDGTKTVIEIDDRTTVKAGGGFLGINRSRLTVSSLLNGLPVSVKTWRLDDTQGTRLIAEEVTFRKTDLKTATMIRQGTEQGFEEQTAATEALKGRLADLDQYNIKRTANVYFDTGKWVLTEAGKSELCSVAAEAEKTPNALILVVGYTDNVGDEDFNQELSEKRASRVMNHLQQACRWKPFRMLTPTGMAESDPAADNSTEEGRAQNRRVSVNVLVSKAVDGF
ncbi:OmpA family protein [Sandarakinorhabdus rubra]|uniref:OmpA family protein n=1 Tax=Sandarakinorhabdus rubra TaxID=2672568 RepID=UPI0013D8F10B|nr:OmpA family protein [Sandarakinorhabdus rubra]